MSNRDNLIRMQVTVYFGNSVEDSIHHEAFRLEGPQAMFDLLTNETLSRRAAGDAIEAAKDRGVDLGSAAMAHVRKRFV